DTGAAVATRRRYHHGDLANALTQEATALAREGGPEAVVLREAARRVGVSPTAAYRHFAAHEDLLYTVKVKAQDELASAMEQALEQMPLSGSAAEDAMMRSYVIGEAYVNFALAEPGLFRTAFVHIDGVHLPQPCSQVTEGGSEPIQPPPGVEGFRSFQLLGGVLDDLVANGLLPAARRPNAEFAPWSAVHGLATLFLDGPLDILPKEQREQVLRSTLDTIVKGLVDGTS
ncbi:MAG TPA: TetR/AcrR family transcriptional regulator, partial [Actinocrinis sp.]|uniref:TetR/AcrR family transcriptional regulator n=1 Tax=Actinocrinis sp. TaxID=1920516 RepID=UPI002DDD81BB